MCAHSSIPPLHAPCASDTEPLAHCRAATMCPCTKGEELRPPRSHRGQAGLVAPRAWWPPGMLLAQLGMETLPAALQCWQPNTPQSCGQPQRQQPCTPPHQDNAVSCCWEGTKQRRWSNTGHCVQHQPRRWLLSTAPCAPPG